LDSSTLDGLSEDKDTEMPKKPDVPKAPKMPKKPKIMDDLGKKDKSSK
jgi:hypothetical protein